MAERMLGLPPARLLTAALGSLAPIWGVSAKALRAQLTGWWAHDWSDDPFTRGAYSYPVAGYESGPAQLGKPVGGTLFFAGEATAEELGTVHGALASGIRAAKEVLRKTPRD